MKRFDLDAAQNTDIERAFLSMPPQEGVQEKIEFINETMLQTAKKLYVLARKSPEQTLALRKLQEAQHWFNQAVIKYGAN